MFALGFWTGVLAARRVEEYTELMSRPRQADGRVHGVVVACCDERGRWLCIRRSRHVAAPLKVCFPGGAVELHETQESAVVREMREELGIGVAPGRCVWKWKSPTSELTLFGWTAIPESLDLVPDPDEVAEVLWLTGEEVANHPDAMGTNREFVVALTEQSRGVSPRSQHSGPTRPGCV